MCRFRMPARLTAIRTGADGNAENTAVESAFIIKYKFVTNS